MRDSIKNRISRRRYLNEPLDAALVIAIRMEIEGLNQRSGLTMAYVPDAAEAFRSMRKSYGLFSGVRSVIVMKGPAELPALAERIGYYGEMLVLDMTHMGFGTCWVGGTFDREKFTIPTGERMLCVITLGAVEAQSSKEKLIRKAISRNRKPAKSRMRGYAEAPAWVREAMEAVRLAPSAVNSQKPVFTYERGVVTATVRDTTAMDLIDLGIAKLHFAAEAVGSFTFGKGGRFVKAGDDTMNRGHAADSVSETESGGIPLRSGRV